MLTAECGWLNETKSDGVVATKEVHFHAIDGSFGHK